MKIEWPLWECIPRKALAKLALYQWDKYTQILDILSVAEARTRLDMKGESLEEIDRIMRRPPSRSRGNSG